MTKIVTAILFVIITGCGQKNDIAPIEQAQDEMTGIPVRPLEEKAPDSDGLPAPSDALGLPATGVSKGSGVMSMVMNFEGSGKVLSSVGFYSRGRIWSYWQAFSNNLWNVRNPSRAYASYYIEEPMREAVNSYLASSSFAQPIKIWDISGEGGGPLGGHASHQMGLDLDIEYPYNDKKIKSVYSINYGLTWSLVKSFVATGKVQRIFSDNYIKRRLCSEAKQDQNVELAKETLKRIRYWPGHSNHIHVRFYCPDGDKLCVPQTEVPSETGCPKHVGLD